MLRRNKAETSEEKRPGIPISKPLYIMHGEIRTPPMDEQTKARLAAAGFIETNIQDFLGLPPEETELVETRVALAHLIKRLRKEVHISQAAVAKRVGSDQSRIARAEKNDPTVSIDMMFRVAYALGADRRQVAYALCA